MLNSKDQFSTLTQQVAQLIAKDIRRGVWKEQLPPERYLASTMQVSRRTLRGAIVILRKQKVILTTPSYGSKITKRPRLQSTTLPQRKVIGLMLPESLDHLKSSTMVFIDELRALLYANSFRLEVHVGHRYYSNRPAAALTELTAKFPSEGWILAYSNPINQRWFQSQGISAIIAGTAHENVELPDVDIDMVAACRHAANLLVQRGHRRLGLVIEDPRLPGDKKSADGFQEGAQLLGKTEVTTKICQCPPDMTGIRHLVARLIKGPEAVSALVITNAYQYLAIFSILSRMGIKIPRQISLISRNDEPFCQFLDPEPTRYTCAPQTRAKAVYFALMRTIQGEQLPKRHFLLLPDFIQGATVADHPS